MPITWQPLVSQSFSKLHNFPNVIVHQLAYFLLLNFQNGRLQSRKNGGFPENWHFSFIGPHCLTSIQ